VTDRAAPIARALVRLGPVLIIALFACTTLAVMAVAGATLGYDAETYLQAADRLFAGRPLYDSTVGVAGGFGIYLYPPPFALVAVPFALPPEPLGLWAWLVTMVAAFLVGTALLPVRTSVRWWIVLLAALSFPFLYAVKLGQVGPILYFAFAIGWRWIDRAGVTGLAVAAGAMTKLQPALLFGWMVLTGRWRAFAIGLAAVALAAIVVTAVAGAAIWSDYVALLVRINKPITTPQNLAMGAIAYRAGASMDLAALIQWVSLAATVAVTGFAWLRRDAVTGFVVGIVASQLLSPVIWSHYAMLLLLPVALLLQRRQWWAVAIPLVTWLPWDVTYPVAFAAGMLGPVLTAPGAGVAPARRAERDLPPSS
jgi:alpha-1,2-mannosyltransferase